MPSGTVADSGGNPVLDTSGRPVQLSPDRYGDHHRRRRNRDQGERPGREDRGRTGDRSDADRAPKATRGTAPTRRQPRSPSPGLVQGAIERSNVQPVMEVTRMMNDLRQFKFVTQFVQAEADRQQTAIDKLLPPGS